MIFSYPKYGISHIEVKSSQDDSTRVQWNYIGITSSTKFWLMENQTCIVCPLSIPCLVLPIPRGMTMNDHESPRQDSQPTM
jgi:hypothetical protein